MGQHQRLVENLINQKENYPVLKKLITQPAFFQLPQGKHPRGYSRFIDKILGYKIAKIEQGLLNEYQAFHKSPHAHSHKKKFAGTQAWIGLHPQVLLTPYCDIFDFLKLVSKQRINKVVDLGAAYGRVGLVMNCLFPEAEFIGYEIVEERQLEANRIFQELDLSNCEMRRQNILEEGFVIPSADLYFIYDFSDPHDLKIVLNRLAKKMYRERFFVVALGEGVRSLIQLKYPVFWVGHGVIHKEKWSLYSSFCDLS